MNYEVIYIKHNNPKVYKMTESALFNFFENAIIRLIVTLDY